VVFIHPQVDVLSPDGKNWVFKGPFAVATSRLSSTRRGTMWFNTRGARLVGWCPSARTVVGRNRMAIYKIGYFIGSLATNSKPHPV
jgi:hypothetical protein